MGDGKNKVCLRENSEKLIFFSLKTENAQDLSDLSAFSGRFWAYFFAVFDFRKVGRVSFTFDVLGRLTEQKIIDFRPDIFWKKKKDSRKYL